VTISPQRCYLAPIVNRLRAKECGMGLIGFLIIGLIAGWLAGKIMRGGGFGVLGDMVVGVVGAFIGGFLFRLLGLFPGGGLLPSLIVATIGAIVLLWLIRLVKKA
jgi:uncharacterized membrane protein YeaQ/YmgE (transglycosylase-associated protein family)